MTNLTPGRARELRLAGKEVEVFLHGEWRHVRHFEVDCIGMIRIIVDIGIDRHRAYASGLRCREAPQE